MVEKWIRTYVKTNGINLPFSLTNGRRIDSLPPWNKINVGNCLLSDDVLILYLVAVSGLLDRSTFPNFKLSKLYLLESSEKTLEKSIHGGLQAVYSSTSQTIRLSSEIDSSRSSPLKYETFSGPPYVGSGSNNSWTTRNSVNDRI